MPIRIQKPKQAFSSSLLTLCLSIIFFNKAFFTRNLTSIKVALKNYAIKKVISEKLAEGSKRGIRHFKCWIISLIEHKGLVMITMCPHLLFLVPVVVALMSYLLKNAQKIVAVYLLHMFLGQMH